MRSGVCTFVLQGGNVFHRDFERGGQAAVAGSSGEAEMLGSGGVSSGDKHGEHIISVFHKAIAEAQVNVWIEESGAQLFVERWMPTEE